MSIKKITTHAYTEDINGHPFRLPADLIMHLGRVCDICGQQVPDNAERACNVHPALDRASNICDECADAFLALAEDRSAAAIPLEPSDDCAYEGAGSPVWDIHITAYGYLSDDAGTLVIESRNAIKRSHTIEQSMADRANDPETSYQDMHDEIANRLPEYCEVIDDNIISIGIHGEPSEISQALSEDLLAANVGLILDNADFCEMARNLLGER